MMCESSPDDFAVISCDIRKNSECSYKPCDQPTLDSTRIVSESSIAQGSSKDNSNRTSIEGNSGEGKIDITPEK